MPGEPHGSFLLAPFAALAEESAKQSRRPPHAQRQSRCGFGAALLSGCYSTFDLCGPFAPAAPAVEYAWCGCLALGLYWLLAGLFGGRARGPLVGGLGLCLEAGAAGWLLWNEMYPAPADWPIAALLLHGSYLAVLASCLAQILSALIALPGDAERVVRRNMAAKNPPIIPVRR